MSQVKITLNKREIEADTDETILEVSKRHNISIPTLCHDVRLEPYGSCRVCLVKVQGAKSFVPSCSTKVTEGMVIDTESPDVIEARRLSLSLLISDHYGDCVAPCSLECPANIDIQGYISLIGAKKYSEALKLIKEKNPLPLVIGRICPHPCETVCRRNNVDEAIAINNLKRFAADYDSYSEYPYIPKKEPVKGKSIAVIGSGPAGLSCAYYLSGMGYDVTIFEKESQPGGMLRYGIPEYRLPNEVLDREIKLVLDLGVKIEFLKELGRDFELEDLKKAGFDAAFLGLGAQKSTEMRIEGEKLENVISGLGFLYDIATGRGINLARKKVVVVGGGNTAMDASRSSLRLGAEKVIVLYRRTKKEMPANETEIREAFEEGIVFDFLSAPVKITKENGRLGIECIRMKLGEPDSSGRRRPIPIEGSNYLLEADYLITAIGQRPEIPYIHKDLITSKDTIKANPENGTTSEDFIFAAGDCVTGAATAIEAIAGGRKAALSIDRFLCAETKPEDVLKAFNISKGSLEEIPEEFYKQYEKAKRVIMPTLAVKKRVKNFEEIERGLEKEEAKKEASRCLECGCTEGFSCLLRDYSTLYSVTSDEFSGQKNLFPGYNNLIPRRPPILKDKNKCIKCGTCIRICDELWGLHIYGFVKRGFETEVLPYFNLDLKDTECDFCGQCADSCPTGALSLRSYLPKQGPYKTEKKKGLCINCSLGCELEFNIYENMLVKNSSSPLTGENEGNLCVRGRFGYRYLSQDNRNLNFLEIKDRNRDILNPEDALRKASGLLKSSERVGIFTSTHLSNEEYKKINELETKLEKAESFHIPYDFAEYQMDEYPVIGKSKNLEYLLKPISIPNLTDFEKSDIIILFNILTGRSFPILEMKIRKAVNRGVKLYIINERATRLDEKADEVFRIKESLYADFLDFIGLHIINASGEVSPEVEDYYSKCGIKRSIPFTCGIKYEKIKRLIRDIMRHRKAIYITDEDLTGEKELRAFIEIVLLKGDRSKLLMMQRGTNPLGAKKYGRTHSDSSFVTKDTVKSFDTLFLYKLPGFFQFEKQSVIHTDFKPFSHYGRYGIFIPSSSLLETGGTTYLYNGKKVQITGVLDNNKSIDNIKNLSKMIERL